MGSAANLFALHKNGTEFPVDIMLRPTKGASGSFVLSYVRDTTEQRAAQEAVRRNDQQLRSVVDSIHDYAIYLLDSEGHVKTTTHLAIKPVIFNFVKPASALLLACAIATP